MQTYNQDSYGELLRVRFDEDVNLSAATSLQVELEPRQGSSLTKTAILGTVDVYVGDQLFSAKKYIEYTTEEDVFDYVGMWRAKGLAVFASSETSTDYQSFRVTE